MPNALAKQIDKLAAESDLKRGAYLRKAMEEVVADQLAYKPVRWVRGKPMPRKG